MPGAGIEPARGYPQGILSPSRLANFATPATQTGAAYSAAPVVLLHPFRAGNGTRTRDPNLGKVVLYQLSYSRVRRMVDRLGV